MRSYSNVAAPHSILAVASYLLFTGVLAVSAGCTRLVVDRLVPAIGQVNAVAASKTDLEFMGKALPASILNLEGLLALDPDNLELIRLVAGSKCGYAVGWIEDQDPTRASRYYLEGQNLALDGLYKGSRSYRRAIDAGSSKSDAIATIKDPDMVPLLFELGTCGGAWLALNVKDPIALFNVPFVLGAMKKIIELDPNYFYGSAYMFLGAYYARTPAMAGGGLAKGKEYFQKAFTISKHKMLMTHYWYAKAYATTLRDLKDPDSGLTGRQIFDKMIKTIENADANTADDLALANAVAKRKAKNLKAERKSIFGR